MFQKDCYAERPALAEPQRGRKDFLALQECSEHAHLADPARRHLEEVALENDHVGLLPHLERARYVLLKERVGAIDGVGLQRFLEGKELLRQRGLARASVEAVPGFATWIPFSGPRAETGQSLPPASKAPGARMEPKL